jgi:hypothetical protein
VRKVSGARQTPVTVADNAKAFTYLFARLAGDPLPKNVAVQTFLGAGDNVCDFPVTNAAAMEGHFTDICWREPGMSDDVCFHLQTFCEFRSRRQPAFLGISSPGDL